MRLSAATDALFAGPRPAGATRTYHRHPVPSPAAAGPDRTALERRARGVQGLPRGPSATLSACRSTVIASRKPREGAQTAGRPKEWPWEKPSEQPSDDRREDLG